MRLIDANELSAEFYSRLMDSVEKIPTKNIIGFINYAPTIDAVPVVRCKDCRHWENGNCNYYQDTPGGDWYCADGERRDDD